METYWIIDNLIFEEEYSLINQGYSSALAMSGYGDFAYTVIISKSEEQNFYLKLKFADRLTPYNPSQYDSMI